MIYFDDSILIKFLKIKQCFICLPDRKSLHLGDSGKTPKGKKRDKFFLLNCVICKNFFLENG